MPSCRFLYSGCQTNLADKAQPLVGIFVGTRPINTWLMILDLKEKHLSV
jgi:hypothetical protein